MGRGDAIWFKTIGEFSLFFLRCVQHLVDSAASRPIKEVVMSLLHSSERWKSLSSCPHPHLFFFFFFHELVDIDVIVFSSFLFTGSVRYHSGREFYEI